MKTTILKSNITNPDILDRGLALVTQKALTIGLTIDFDVHITTQQFTSLPLNTDVVSGGYEVSPNEIYLEEQKYLPSDFTVLVHNWDAIIPKPTNPADNGYYAQIPEQWYSGSVAVPPEQVFCEFFFHELSHEVAWKYGKTDLTHLLVNMNLNPALYAQWSSKPTTDFYLWLISQNMLQQPTVLAHNDPSYKYDTLTGQLNPLYTGYIAPVTNVIPEPEVVLTRKSDDKVETLGSIEIGTFSKCTLELPWKENAKNISCIPKGRYLCQWRFKLSSLAYHYQIMNVPNRSGVFIHAGNYFTDTQGCVLLGTGYTNLNSDMETDIINSKVTVQAFEQLMGKKDFHLTIK